MSLMRWDPFRELENMNDRLNRMFVGNRTPTRPGGEPSKDSMTLVDWSPSVDVAETAEEFQLKAELPEVKKEDVKVSVENGVLRIEGQRHQEKEEKGKRFHRVERSYGSFLRTFSLPDNVDDKSVRAEFKDGVLNVRLPKMVTPKEKAIEVKIG